MEDDLTPNTTGFFDERNLEAADAPAVEYCRLPGDDAPCPPCNPDEGAGACFACVYGPGLRNGQRASVGRSVYEDMIDIITNNYGSTTNGVLVNMVHEFYEMELRVHFNYPEWTKTSIWEHIVLHMQSDHVQISESIQTMSAAIETLRAGGICKRVGEQREVDHKNMRLYIELTKARDALVTSRAKRKATT